MRRSPTPFDTPSSPFLFLWYHDYSEIVASNAQKQRAHKAPLQVDYETGCQELDAQEKLDGNLERLRALRAQITEAKVKQQHLRTQEQDLDMRIATLEARLDTRTRELLGMAHPLLQTIR